MSVIPAMSKPQTEASALAQELAALKAGDRLRLLHERFGSRLVMSSSFGLQAAVMLHLIHENAPEVPVVFIDTGYLFPETYQYAEELTQRWDLDVRVYQPKITAARQEALYGKLWEQGKDGLDRYSLINKVEPMDRALKEIGGDIWLSGVRRAQSSTRSQRDFAEQQKRTLKIYPILDWADAQVNAYMHQHQIPQHPLASQGYVTMGDWHSTRPVGQDGDVESTRFNGEKYECGLHLDSSQQDFQI